MTLVAMILLPLIAVGLLVPAVVATWRGQDQTGTIPRNAYVCLAIAVGVLTVWGWLGWVA